MKRLTFMFLCFISGMLGAYLMLCLQIPLRIGQRGFTSDDVAGVVYAGEQRSNIDVLRVHKLEVVDQEEKIRAVLSTDGSGYASFRMLSKEDTPVVQLNVREDPSHPDRHIPYGMLTMSAGTTAPLIQLGTRYPGAGSLLFSSPRTHGMLSVGYDIAGDVEEQQEHGVWGMIVKGKNHHESVMGVRTDNWVPGDFIIPAADSQSVGDTHRK